MKKFILFVLFIILCLIISPIKYIYLYSSISKNEDGSIKENLLYINGEERQIGTKSESIIVRTPFHIEIPESSYNFNEKWKVKAYGNEKIIVRVVDPINIKLFCDTIGEPLKLIVVKEKRQRLN